MAENNKPEWTTTEIAYLKANYKKQSAKEIAEHLGKSRCAIIGKARRLGLSKPMDNPIQRKQIEELTVKIRGLGSIPERGCKYHDVVMGWCGKPTQHNEAYCEKCQKIVYTPSRAINERSYVFYN